VTHIANRMSLLGEIQADKSTEFDHEDRVSHCAPLRYIDNVALGGPELSGLIWEAGKSL